MVHSFINQNQDFGSQVGGCSISEEKHANTTSAILYDALEEVSGAVEGLSLDH
jgi:hypothetical protein